MMLHLVLRASTHFAGICTVAGDSVADEMGVGQRRLGPKMGLASVVMACLST